MKDNREVSWVVILFHLIAIVVNLVVISVRVANWIIGDDDKVSVPPVQYNVVATLSADNKDEVRFICLEDSRYYVCDKDGLGEELVFEEAMNFVGVAEVEGKTTFFCRDLNELVIVECTPRVLQEVDFDW